MRSIIQDGSDERVVYLPESMRYDTFKSYFMDFLEDYYGREDHRRENKKKFLDRSFDHWYISNYKLCCHSFRLSRT